jgi:ribosomal protein S18 acetylase RimI-like enzyme
VIAERSDLNAIGDLLDGSFDKYADQLPTVSELEDAISERQIALVKCDRVIAALLFFETQGFTSTIRYWVVAEQFRSRRFGSALMRHYFAAQSSVRRFVLWVVGTNSDAVRKYRHFGYAPDGLVDHVLANGMVPA